MKGLRGTKENGTRRRSRGTYFVARVEGIRRVQLALGLAAAVRQRGRPDERLMMELHLRSGVHRAAVRLSLAIAAAVSDRAAGVPQLEIRVALWRAREALVHVAVVGRLTKN